MYYRITKENEKHLDYQYVTGHNKSINEMFFTTESNLIFNLLDGYWKRQVMIPENVDIDVHNIQYDIFKSSEIILHEKEKITLSDIQHLLKLNNKACSFDHKTLAEKRAILVGILDIGIRFKDFDIIDFGLNYTNYYNEEFIESIFKLILHYDKNNSISNSRYLIEYLIKNKRHDLCEYIHKRIAHENKSVRSKTKYIWKNDKLKSANESFEEFNEMLKNNR